MKKEKAIIFGASRLGEIAYEILHNNYDILYFCDNDKNKWNKELCEKNILSINDLVDYKDVSIIIASMYSTEISIQLSELEFKKVFSFRYYGDMSQTSFNGKYEIDKVYNKEEYFNINIDKKLQNIYKDDFTKIYMDSRNIDTNSNTNVIYDKKNVLFISHFFPPMGGTAVQRSLKFCKYLKKYGWNPIVITTNDSYKFLCDSNLLSEFKYDFSIIQIGNSKMNPENFDEETVQQIVNLYFGILGYDEVSILLEKIKKGVISLIDLFPLKMHGQIYWTNSVLKNIQKYIDFNKINLIYTTSPPYSPLIIGYYLKNKYNKPWIADMRDEWTNEPYNKYKDKFKYNFERLLEFELVNNVDKLINVSTMAEDNYFNYFKIEKNKLEVITNGYDEDDFIDINSYKEIGIKFIVTHNGNFQDKRQPDTFLKALKNLIEKDCINKEKIRVNFNQNIDKRIEELIFNWGLSDVVKFKGVLSHLESLRECSKSNLLLHVVGPDEGSKRIYTGKIFEYLRLNRPIISLSTKGSLVESLLDETSRGICVEFNDVNSIESTLVKFYKEWEDGNEKLFEVDDKIKIYQRECLTKKLAQIFDNMI